MKMKSVIYTTIISCILVSSQAWVDVRPAFYENDLKTVTDEVKEKTQQALQSAKSILKERFNGNQSRDVVTDMMDILNKAQGTLARIEKWIAENNVTGELINEKEECVVYILEETTDETLDYLLKLEKLCWNSYDWDEPVKSVIANMTDIAEEGKSLYAEFLEDISECTLDGYYVQECVAVADEWARIRADELLYMTNSYMDVIYSIDQGYHENGKMCQRAIRERINWIAKYVFEGLKECKRIT